MRKYLYLIYLVSLAVFGACSNPELDNTLTPELFWQDVSLHLPPSLSYVPSTASNELSSYEDHIETMDLLVFQSNGQDYTFSYRAQCRRTNQPNQKYVTRLQTGLNQKIILLANVEQELNSLISSKKIQLGDTEQSVLSNLQFVKKQEWFDPEKERHFIPMYAAVQADITTQTTSIGSSCTYLIRMLARIDVQADKALTDYSLGSAALFNRTTGGYIAYQKEHWDDVNKLVIQAEVPSEVEKVKVPTISYKASDNQIKGSIYCFESVGLSSPQEATAVVLGLKSNKVADSKIRYHRVDIPSRDNKIGELIRNHLYTIKISKVLKEGFDTAEQAYDSHELTLKLDVEDWTAHTIGTDLDAQYYLMVSQGVFTLDEVESGVYLAAYTNYPEEGGIKLDYGDFTDTEIKEEVRNAHYLKLYLKSNHGGTLSLSVGNLSYTIKIGD